MKSCVASSKGSVKSKKSASSKGSVKSKRSGSSHSSKASHLSNSSASKKLEYATKAAALKTELKYLDIYPEFQRIQTQKELEINEEQLKAVEKIEQEDHGVRFEQESVKQHLDTPACDETHDHLDRYFKSQTIAAKLSTPTTNVSWLSRYAPVTPTLASVVQSCGVTAAGQNPGGLNPGISGVCSTGAPTSATSAPPLSDLNPKVPEFRHPVSHSGSIPNTLTKTTWVHSESVATGSQLPVFSSCAPHRSVLHDGHNMPPVTTQQPARNSSMQVLDFAKLFSSHMDLSGLPVPEPPVFSGDPLKYPDWKVTFETLIERRAIPPSERMLYLKKYLIGAAREAVEGYFLVSSSLAFDDAKNLLQERYGNPFVISPAFKDRLDAWPKIPYRDGIALRRFPDFLRQCQTAMQSMNSLNILNDDRENRKMLAKLPDYLVTRWGCTVANWKQQGKGFPPFCEVQSFVGIEADIACDPITSFQSLKVESSRSSRNFTGSKVASSTFATDGREMNKGTPSLDKCALCTKVHNLENCFQFFSMFLQERKDYIREKNLCFACLSYGHKSFVCKRATTCKICSRKHPTPLHGDVRSLSDSTSESKATHNTNSDVIESDTEVKATSVNTKTCLFNKIIKTMFSDRASVDIQ